MNDKINRIIAQVKAEAGLSVGISLGIYLFILFFQPFPFKNPELNDNLVLVAGLAAIVFFFIMLSRDIIPVVFEKQENTENEMVFPQYAGSLLMLVLSTTAFAFYLRYVAGIEITFFIMFKVLLICLAPPVLLRYYDIMNELKNRQEELILEKKGLQKKVEQFGMDVLQKTIVINSENKSENISLPAKDLVLIRSADNYAEIFFLEEGQIKRALLRNTLKNIENQLSVFPNFVRCHRAFIVNSIYVERMEKSFGNHFLLIKGFEEKIPVSRVYLLKIKEFVTSSPKDQRD
ncbi:MAG: LytTR family transcriptional regulator [Sphingobacteriales bacterium]|nr:LytTR family transcriptional regulator [Sphingobacteriales bacterium]